MHVVRGSGGKARVSVAHSGTGRGKGSERSVQHFRTLLNSRNVATITDFLKFYAPHFQCFGSANFVIRGRNAIFTDLN